MALLLVLSRSIRGDDHSQRRPGAARGVALPDQGKEQKVHVPMALSGSVLVIFPVTCPTKISAKNACMDFCGCEMSGCFRGLLRSRSLRKWICVSKEKGGAQEEVSHTQAP